MTKKATKSAPAPVSQTNAGTESSTAEATYFDLHTTGIGYLNRIRRVEVRKGKPFTAVTVAALHGASDDVEYSYIDCTVTGSEAEKLVHRCAPAVAAGKKVLVAFRIGDIWTDVFTYTKGEKIGQPGACLKGRLLYISWIKVDGETVYQAKPKDAEGEPQWNAAADQQQDFHAA